MRTGPSLVERNESERPDEQVAKGKLEWVDISHLFGVVCARPPLGDPAPVFGQRPPLLTPFVAACNDAQPLFFVDPVVLLALITLNPPLVTSPSVSFYFSPALISFLSKNGLCSVYRS